MPTDKEKRHREGEAIAAYALQQLGPVWRIAYKGSKDRWEIRSIHDRDLICGSYRYVDGEWCYEPNTNLSEYTRPKIDGAVEAGMERAIGLQSQEVK